MSFKQITSRSFLSDEQLFDTVNSVVSNNFKNMPLEHDKIFINCERNEYKCEHYEKIYNLLEKYFNNDCDIKPLYGFDRSGFFVDETNSYEMFYSNISERSFNVLITFMLSKKNEGYVVLQIQRLRGCAFHYNEFTGDLLNVLDREFENTHDDDFIPPSPKLRRQNAIGHGWGFYPLHYKNLMETSEEQNVIAGKTYKSIVSSIVDNKKLYDEVKSKKNSMKKYMKNISDCIRNGGVEDIGDVIISLCSDINYLSIMNEDLNDDGNILKEMIYQSHNEDSPYKRYLIVAFRRIIQGKTFTHDSILRKLEVISAMTNLGFDKRVRE